MTRDVQTVTNVWVCYDWNPFFSQVVIGDHPERNPSICDCPIVVLGGGDGIQSNMFLSVSSFSQTKKLPHRVCIHTDSPNKSDILRQKRSPCSSRSRYPLKCAGKGRSKLNLLKEVNSTSTSTSIQQAYHCILPYGRT